MTTAPPFEAGSARHRRLSAATLVARDRELAQVREAASSPPALIVVEGEAGIGKSRLVREAFGAGGPGDRRALSGACHRLRDPFLLGPIVEALRCVASESPPRGLSPLAGALRPLLPELADILPAKLEPIGDARAERHRVFRALRELLDALGPTVCVLEDLHWADEGTLEFLAFLLSVPPPGLALVLTYRGEDLRPGSPLGPLTSRMPEPARQLSLELAGLAADDVRHLVQAILEVEVSNEFAGELHRWSAGNPFAVEEILRMLADKGQLALDGGRLASAPAWVGVPPTIGESIRERLTALDRDGRIIAEAAAVLGTPADAGLLARMTRMRPARVDTALAQMLCSRLLEERPGGRVEFRHALAADAVVAEIPEPQRRALHVRAGRLLEALPAPRPFGRLAYHFREGRSSSYWVRYAEAAADAAMSRGDDREAARIYADALLSACLGRATRIRIAVKLGIAAVYSASPAAAIEILERILADEELPSGTRGELRCSLARLRSHTGDESWRGEMILAATELSRRPDLAAPAMATLAWPTMADGKLEDDLAWLGRATVAAGRARDPRVKRAVDLQRAAILLSVGDPGGWQAIEEVSRRPETVADKVALLRGYHNLSVVTLGLGHYRAAESFLAKALRIDQELERVWWEPWFGTTRIALDWRAGRWTGLEHRIRELLETTIGRPALALGNELILASLLLACGRVVEAERIFARALRLAEPRRWMSAQVTATANLARIRLARSDEAGAAEIAARGLEVVRRKGIWVWAKDLAPVAVEALVSCRSVMEARQLADEFAAGVGDRDAPAARAGSAFCQGVVLAAECRHHAGARALSRAESLWHELPSPYQAAHAREARARCLRERDGAQAADLLRGALARFDDLGARWDSRRVRVALREQGLVVRPGAPSARRSYGTVLSPREAEVARLAGAGMKNREIAATLFLSPRTVEAHVASALRKLGVHSRAALAVPDGARAPAD